MPATAAPFAMLLLAATAAAQGTAEWALVFAKGDVVEACDLATGARLPVAETLLQPPLPDGVATGTALAVAVWSPNGRRVAVATSWRESARRNGRVTLFDAAGAELADFGNGTQEVYLHPAWVDDDHLLLLGPHRDQATPNAVLWHDLATGVTAAFPDQAISLTMRPSRLQDGRLLHLRRRPAGRGTELDLALLHLDRPGQPQVLVKNAGALHFAAASPNGLVVWFAGPDSAGRIDLVADKVTHHWPLAALAEAGARVRLGEAVLRPDGDALAVTFWPVDAYRGSEPGLAHAVVLEVVAQRRGHGETRLTRHELLPMAQLRGFVRLAELPR